MFKILINLQVNSKKNFSPKEKKENQKRIKEATERYYKEISYLKKYLQLNFKVIYKLLKKHRNYLTDLKIDHEEFSQKYNYMLLNTFVMQNTHKLKKLLSAVESIYLKEFYSNFEER